MTHVMRVLPGDRETHRSKDREEEQGDRGGGRIQVRSKETGEEQGNTMVMKSDREEQGDEGVEQGDSREEQEDIGVEQEVHRMRVKEREDWSNEIQWWQKEMLEVARIET